MPFFVANWKMNKTRGEARAFAERLGARLSRGVSAGVELAVAPPFTALDAARDPQGRWSLAAQNVAAEDAGAFTGEVSARMLADAGCRYAIVGPLGAAPYLSASAAPFSRASSRAPGRRT